LPSVEPPFMATKIEPGRTRRESYSMPVMDCAESPPAPMAVTSLINSFQIILSLIVDCGWGGCGVSKFNNLTCN